MTRDIKFRAWDKIRKRWINRVLAGCNIDDDSYICNLVWSETENDWINFDEFCGDIVQYTGLKDKNGVEIYEGDVVKYSVDGRTETLHIFSDSGCFKTKISSLKAVHLICEVIGNIYENPELIKTESE